MAVQYGSNVKNVPKGGVQYSMGTGVTKSNTTDVVNSNPTPTASNGSDAMHHNTVTQAPTATTPPTPASPVTPTTPSTPSSNSTASPGSYQGVPIIPGNEQEIQKQMAAIDAQKNTPQPAPAPSSTPQAPAVQTAPASTPATPTSPTETASNTIDTAQAQLDQANADFQSKADAVSKTILDIQHGAIPLNAGEQAQVNALSQQYGQLIQSQQLQNTSAANGAYIRGYQTGSAEYDPTFAVKTIGAIVTAGSQAVADLNTKMAGAVADLTQSFHNNDIAAVKDAYTVYEDAYTKRADTLQKTIDNAQAQIKAAQDAQQKIQDNIDAITKEAAQNGAPTDVLSKLNSATSQAEAIGLAAQYLTDPTSTAGQYAAYMRDAQAKGLTPMTPGDFLAKQKANETYSSAYASAKAQADVAGLGAPGDTGGTTPDPTATGITGATGLSLQAFNYLTQGTASMSRMPAAQRNAIMAEANNFLNKNGIDISTFQSQYKAYNDVLQKNVERANQTKVMANEVSGSADALISAIQADKASGVSDPAYHGGDMSSLQAANVLDIMAGKQVNSKFAQTYSTQINIMANDLAGYLAASRGATSPDDSDKRDAANIISNGMNSNSTQAFKDAINANEQKVAGVVHNAANDAQKQVWDLFGVGGQFTPKAEQVNPVDAVNSYVSAHPDQAQTVSQLYSLPGWTDQDVLDYLNNASSTSQ